RIAAERPITARHIADQFSLLPPNIDRTIHLFDTAVKASALETTDQLGLKVAQTQIVHEEERLNRLGDRQMKDVPALVTRSVAGGSAPAAPSPAAAPRGLALANGKEQNELFRSLDRAEKAKQEVDAKDGFSRRAGVDKDRMADE